MSSHYDRILAYLDHELTPEERRQFELEVETNSELRAELNFYRSIVEGIESEGQEELKEFIRSRVNEESTETKTNLWVYAAATVTILMVGYIGIYQYTQTGSLQPAKEFISLSKKSGEKVKFWKKRPKNEWKTDTNFSLNYSDSLSHDYGDLGGVSDDVLAMNTPNYNGDPAATKTDIDDVVKDNNMPSPDFNSESMSASKVPEKKASRILDAEGDIEINEAQGNNDNRKMRKFKEVSPKSNVGKSPSTASASVFNSSKSDELSGSLEPKTSNNSGEIHFVRKVQLVSVQLNSTENQLSENTLYKSPAQRFVVNFFEQDNGTKTRISSMKVYKNKNIILIDLYNLSGENPLVYKIESEYFLELAPNQIFKIPTVIPSDIANPTLVKNKQIINLIQGVDKN